ncbi:unnamed protein product, partial [Mesorhabditis belari]|uniref:Uncharacterized protein n=1 Tax=Mesorhabditis belari TaxID=2138241 RepID=A0AAF3FL40_9BILA
MFSRKSTNNTMNAKIPEESPLRKPRKSRTPTKASKKIESPIDVKNIPLLIPKEEVLSVEREQIPQISKREQAKKNPPPTIPFKMPMDMTTYLKKLTENKLDAPKKGCLKKMGNHSFAADISQSSMAASPLPSFLSEPSPKTLVKKWDEQKQLNVAKARAELLAVVSNAGLKETEPETRKERLKRGVIPVKYTDEAFDEQIKQAVKRINRRSRSQPSRTPRTPASAKTFPKTPAVKKMRLVPLKGLDEPEKKQMMNLSMPVQTPAPKRKHELRLNKSLATEEPSKKKAREGSTQRRVQPPRLAKSNFMEKFTFHFEASRINKKTLNQTIDRTLRKTPMKVKEEPEKTPKARKTVQDTPKLPNPQTIKKDEMKAKKSEKVNTKTSKVNEQKTTEETKRRGKNEIKEDIKDQGKPIQREDNKTSKRKAPEHEKEEKGVSAMKGNVKDEREEKKKINDENKDEMPKKREMPVRSVTLKQNVVKEVIVDKKDGKKSTTNRPKTKEPKRKIFGDVKNTLKKETVTLEARCGQSQATKEQIIDLDAEEKKKNLHSSSFASLL